MSNRLEGIALLKKTCGNEKIVEGWLEGPCASAADIRGIQTFMMDFYDDPLFVHELLEFTLEMGIAFGKAQIEAGADIIGVGDAVASLIGPQLYNDFVWPMEKRLIEALHDGGAKIRLHICGDIRSIMEPIGKLGCEIIDIDSMVPMEEARAKTGPRACLLGGVDPVRELQNGSPGELLDRMAKCHRKAGLRYIVGAGCEVPPATPQVNLQIMSNFAKNNGSQE
jgi:MtaA/CmuA family methyltransferase